MANTTAQDALPLCLPPNLVALTNQKAEGENDQNRKRSVDMESVKETAEAGGDAQNQGEDSLSSSDGAVAPSSGTFRYGSEGERRMQLKRQRDSERQKDSKAKRREEERGGYHRSETVYSSTVHFLSSSESHDLFDINANNIHRDTILDLKCRDKKHPGDSSQNYRHKDGPAKTHCSSYPLSDRRCNETDPLPSKTNDSRERHGEWKPNKVDRVIKDSKGGAESREGVAVRSGGTQWKDEGDNFSNKTKSEERKELEEGERPSSRSSHSSSSASLENSKDERRKGVKKQKKHKKEKKQAALELLEDRQLKKHKKSKKSREKKEDESGGEVESKEREGI